MIAADSDDRRMVSAIHASFIDTKVEAPAESSNKPALMIMPPKKKGGGCS